MSYNWTTSIEQRFEWIVIGQSLGKGFSMMFFWGGNLSVEELLAVLQRSGFFPQTKEVWCVELLFGCPWESRHYLWLSMQKWRNENKSILQISVKLPAFAVAGGRDSHGGDSRSQEPPKHGGKASSRIQWLSCCWYQSMSLGSEIGVSEITCGYHTAHSEEWVKWKLTRLELRRLPHVPPRLLMDRVSISLSYFKVVGPLLQVQSSVFIATSHMGDLTVLSLGFEHECCISSCT